MRPCTVGLRNPITEVQEGYQEDDPTVPADPVAEQVRRMFLDELIEIAKRERPEDGPKIPLLEKFGG